MEKGEKIAIKSHQLYDHNKKRKKSIKENFWILKTETKIIMIFKIKKLALIEFDIIKAH